VYTPTPSEGNHTQDWLLKVHFFNTTKDNKQSEYLRSSPQVNKLFERLHQEHQGSQVWISLSRDSWIDYGWFAASPISLFTEPAYMSYPAADHCMPLQDRFRLQTTAGWRKKHL
jgi:hypothetical protein